MSPYRKSPIMSNAIVSCGWSSSFKQKYQSQPQTTTLPVYTRHNMGRLPLKELTTLCTSAGFTKSSYCTNKLMWTSDIDHVTWINHRKHTKRCEQLYVITNNYFFGLRNLRQTSTGIYRFLTYEPWTPRKAYKFQPHTCDTEWATNIFIARRSKGEQKEIQLFR